jgi:hypothetical protein
MRILLRFWSNEGERGQALYKRCEPARRYSFHSVPTVDPVAVVSGYKSKSDSWLRISPSSRV